MPLQLQGTWTIDVQKKNPAALPQRYIVSNASSGNGVYIGFEGAPSVTVTGANWTLNIQANEEYDLTGKWINSTIVQGPIQTVGNQLISILNSEDLIQDNSYDDLVLRLSRTVPVAPPPPSPPPVTPPPVTPPPIIPTPPPEPPPPPKPVPLVPGKVFTKIPEDDKLPRQKILLTKGIWSDDSGSLYTFFTQSLNSVSSSYKIEVFNKVPLSCGSEVQFELAYGHVGGSGSQDLGGYDWLTPSKAVYTQYRNLCLPPGQQKFKLGTKELDHIYVINIRRERYGDKIDEGNIELNLAQLSGSFFGNRNAHTGSNVKVAGNGNIIRLVDDSKLDFTKDLSSNAFTASYIDVSSSLAPLVYDIGPSHFMVSGTIETGIYNKTNPEVYGILYPKMGIIILDGDKMDSKVGFLSVSGSDVDGQNAYKLFTSISGSSLYTDASGDVLSFQARKTEYQFCEYYFIRVLNQDYNFTNNPSYVSGSDQYIKDDFLNNQKVFITNVGLYNNNYELLAVAKISEPIPKDYVTEALFTVKLKY